MSGHEIWQTIARELPDQEERLVVYLSFALDLKPREIQRRHRDRYPSTADVYRVKRRRSTGCAGARRCAACWPDQESGRSRWADSSQGSPAGAPAGGASSPRCWRASTVAFLAALQRWPLWAMALATLAPLGPLLGFEAVATYRRYNWLGVFYVLTVAQVGHMIEHVVQITQLRIL